MHFLARELDLSFWTTCPAEAVKLDLLTVLPMQLAFITVSTLKMLEFGVETVSWDMKLVHELLEMAFKLPLSSMGPSSQVIAKIIFSLV